MARDNISRICLGTAQFGMAYGIANRRGKISQAEVSEILDYAARVGIEFLDTAYVYGESEESIGFWIKNHGPKFKVISKMPDVQNLKENDFLKIFDESLRRLGLNKLYGYLVHKFENLNESSKLWSFLRKLKKDGRVEKIGVSLYRPDELAMVEGAEDLGMVQIPSSLFDRRFLPHLARLKQKGIEVHARSVFLQGLALLEFDRWPANLIPAQDTMKKLHDLAKESGIASSDICLNYVLLNRDIDEMVIGIDSLEQLKLNIDSIRRIEEVRKLKTRLDEIYIKEERILMPSLWSKG